MHVDREGNIGVLLSGKYVSSKYIIYFIVYLKVYEKFSGLFKVKIKMFRKCSIIQSQSVFIYKLIVFISKFKYRTLSTTK